MSEPEISVIMGVYNGAKYLRRSVESILGQEGVTFEFVIVDDGSVDDTAEILHEYSSCDSRVRVVSQENRGLTASLIRGCAEARGIFIARQDSDDISLPGRLLELGRLLNSNQRILMASSWTHYVGPQDELIYEVKRPRDPEEATHLLTNARMGPPAHGSVMFRKNAYEQAGGYRREFYYGQDSDLWLRLGEKGLIAYAQSFLYVYRLTPENISWAHRDLQSEFGRMGQLCRKAREQGRDEAGILARAAELRDRIAGRGPGASRAGHRRRLANGNYHIGCGLAKRGDVRASIYFRNAVREWPLHWRAWLKLRAHAR